MKETILVIGGTGKTGRKVVSRLQALNYDVRIGSRRADIPFDWEAPKTWIKALMGVQKVYITFHPDLAVPGALEAIENLMKVARKTDVNKVVLLSGKGEREAELCEQVVINSGIDHTIVRASWFNQNFSEGAFLDFVLADQVALPMPHAKIPFVDTEDIADVVTKVLLDDSYNEQIITVTGPRKMTFEEAIKTIATATGRQIYYQPIPINTFKAGLTAKGLPDDYVWLFGYLFEEVLGNPDNQEVSSDVERVLGRKAIDFKEYVEKTQTSGIWNQPLPQVVIS